MAGKQHLKKLAEKSQGSAARLLDRLPKMVQESIVRSLNYPYDYPELDSFVKCLMAIQLKQGRTGLVGDDIPQSRIEFDHNMRLLQAKPTKIAQVEDIHLPLQSGMTPARHYHPAPKKKLPLIIFYHGGGFLIGSLDTHDEYCRLLAKHAHAQVLSVDYPLAPEHHPSHMVQVCEDALAWSHQHAKQLGILKKRIAVAGDSAGGNLATVVAQRSRDKVYAPQAQLLIYPALDFKSRHPSYYSYKDGLVLTDDDIQRVTYHYAERHQVDLEDPLISPIYGNLKNLPSTYLITAKHDVLHDEGKIYAHQLRQHGVKLHYDNYEEQTHGFINLTVISKRAKKQVIEMSKKFRKFWDKHS
ncbi:MULTISPECIES: alpha/beta hydrolase [Acinetobacter]|uniref:alpha/beta hydrolase n=1 Tax=Acinetobacter TaxID=469 RepID=UPI000537AAC3|nr:alpha/beta hydrolase [Acinetobacter sp. HR7]KGT48921.1 hypothetical protein GW12_00180 [Acinetobacter sp. HR7]